MKQCLFVFLFLFTGSAAWAQNRFVEGRVTAAEDGQPLPGVNVMVQGTAKGTATDIEGRYRLELGPGDNNLSFSFIGYKTTTVTVGERSTLDAGSGSSGLWNSKEKRSDRCSFIVARIRPE